MKNTLQYNISEIHNLDGELFRLAFENAYIGMCLVDLNGKIFKVNKEMSRIFGYSAQELENMTVNDIADERYKDVSFKFIKQASDKTKSHDIFEKKYKHKNGDSITCLINSSGVYDENNNIKFFISHVQDITTRKNAELNLIKVKNELKRTNELIVKNMIEMNNLSLTVLSKNHALEELNQTKNRLLSVISHDLLGPIDALKLAIDSLVTDFDLSDTKALMGYLQLIKKSTDSTHSLLKSLLLWAKSQRNEVMFSPEELNLKEIALLAVDLFADVIKRKQVDIVVNIPADTIVFADKNMLMSVFRNLLSNALKFTSTGKQITIIEDKNNVEIGITVIDQGPGISAENMSKLFMITEDLTTSETNEEKSCGLGLLLCKEFIEKHNGEITVESELDKGSKFRFTLPLYDQQKNKNI
ncbi:MAG: PAS domain-containing sensor histidine kinase [Candidatus Riflebacteria bacterium]|nr:PAS domain-containing sensor histidine kinase [Candidatus Riflebacteria bacterium]